MPQWMPSPLWTGSAGMFDFRENFQVLTYGMGAPRPVVASSSTCRAPELASPLYIKAQPYR